MSAERFGLTWWGRRWIEALEALGADWENRLPRGRTYARKGTVTDLQVRPGRVTARVQGSRATPYRVTIGLPAFDDATWGEVAAALAGQVRLSAALLAGEVPEDVDEVLRTCGVSLFPTARELATDCSCPDWANPCKHVAAVHYVLARTFDEDPFLLPALRGRDRDALLAELRAVRAGAGAPVEVAGPATPTVALADLDASALWSGGDLEAVEVHPAPPTDPTATLRRIGPPPGVLAAATGRLHELVERAAAGAWHLLTATDGAVDPSADPSTGGDQPDPP